VQAIPLLSKTAAKSVSGKGCQSVGTNFDSGTCAANSATTLGISQLAGTLPLAISLWFSAPVEPQAVSNEREVNRERIIFIFSVYEKLNLAKKGVVFKAFS
jgi:hypothetical protein